MRHRAARYRSSAALLSQRWLEKTESKKQSRLYRLMGTRQGEEEGWIVGKHGDPLVKPTRTVDLWASWGSKEMHPTLTTLTGETCEGTIPYHATDVRMPLWHPDPDPDPSDRWSRKDRHRGFTLIELLIVIAIILTIAAIAIPRLLQAREAARIAKAVADIRTLEKDIMTYEVTNGTLPNTLADVGRGDLVDPWGTPYYYWTYADPKYKDVWREDDFLDPLNSSYDLFSAGNDRQWAPHLMESVSRDDIVRANDGAYVGLAWQY